MFFVTAGTTFDIGGVRPDWTARMVAGGDFADEDWVEVRGLNSLGRASGEWSAEEDTIPDPGNPDGAVMTTLTKTTRPTVSMQIVAGILEDDPGQVGMLDAETSLEAFAFRITLPNGARRMFVALVMAADHAFDEANSVLCWAFTLRLQSNMLRD
jgi:hypothetical protein